jgi:hypothetical protein
MKPHEETLDQSGLPLLPVQQVQHLLLLVHLLLMLNMTKDYSKN